MLHVTSRGRRAVLLAATMILSAVLITLKSTAYAAEVETQAQTTARANVEAMAAKVGVASNEAQALQDQKTLMPAVKEAVAAGAGKSLLEHTTNPSVAADLARGYAKHKVTRSALAKKTKPRRHRTAQADPHNPATSKLKPLAHVMAERTPPAAGATHGRSKNGKHGSERSPGSTKAPG